MRKYIAVFRITAINILRYRWEIIMGQVRTIILLVTLFFLWNKVYEGNQTLFNFTHQEILTYVFLAAITRLIVTVSATDQIAGELQSWGKFFSYLLKPIGYFRYWFTVDIVYKIINLFLIVATTAIFLKIANFSLIFPTDPNLILQFLVAVILGSLIYFYIGIIISTTGFWTSHVWGLQFLVVLTMEFSAGAYFPIDVLPQTLQQIIKITPFPYLLYFPVEIYLGKLSAAESFNVIFISTIWLLVTFLVAKFIWKKGLASYEAWGG